MALGLGTRYDAGLIAGGGNQLMLLQRHSRQKMRRNRTEVPPVTAVVVEALDSRTLLAATPVLLRDPSLPTQFVQVGDVTFFMDSAGGFSVTNGTAGGTFPVYGAPTTLTPIGRDLYGIAYNGVWRTDGTAAGTVHVLPMYNNIGGMAKAGGFTAMGGHVYFHADVRGLGNGLWKTDGTPEGTTLLARLKADALIAVGDTVYFAGDDESGAGKELWKTDGTVAGTRMVKDIHPTHGSMAFTGRETVAAVGGRVVFDTLDGLWSSDGTEAGTVKISTQSGRSFTSVGGVSYFLSGSPSGNGSLRVTDGTAAGTRVVKSFGTLGIWQLVNAGGTLYFATRDGNFESTLWKSDGTEAGTVSVAGSGTTIPVNQISNITAVGGSVAFTGGDPAVPPGAYSVWTSDGTAAGTVKVRDTFAEGMQGAPGLVGAVGSIVLFTANDGVGGTELWGVQTATPPVPEARARRLDPYTVVEGQALTLHGYTTADPLPGRPLTYAWDLDNDGVFGETGVAAVRGDETGTDPTFSAGGLDGPGTHVVQFRISDATGYTSTATAEVALINAPPTLNVSGGPAVLVQGNTYTLTLSSSDAGPDAITQWVIDWGDGVTQTVPGTATAVTHNYPATPSTYGISINALDEDGQYEFNRPAAVDAGFGNAGVVSAASHRPAQIAVQDDGKLISLTSVGNGSFNDTKIVVTRFNPDGTLDWTFGDGGRVTFDASPYGEAASSIGIQADGRIVISGALRVSTTPYDRGAILLRLLPDGSLDPSFGGGAGWLAHEFGSYEWLDQLGFTSDGRIVAGGTVDQKLLLVRFGSDGSLDTSFGTGGIVRGVGENEGGVADMAIQPDGKILVIPYASQPVPWPGFNVLRFSADGSPDLTYDGDGRSTVDFGPGETIAATLALTADGSVLVGGSAMALTNSVQAGGRDTVVARLTSAGALDTTFADGGRLRTRTVGIDSNTRDYAGLSGITLRVLRDGRFLLGGSHSGTYLVDRYEPDGAIDASFAPAGRFRVELGATGINAQLWDMDLQADGAPVLYVGTGTNHNPGEALVRLVPPGLSVSVVDAARPEVAISAPPTTSEGSSYTLGLSATDPDGDGITQWIINWGDGSVQVVAGNSSSVTHVFPDGPRRSVVKASAIDGDRSISTVFANVDVANVPPTVTATGGPPVAEGTQYTVQFNATDVGSDTIAKWTINWGDGRVEEYPPDARSAQRKYADSGTYTVVVSATDEDGKFDAAPVTASITNVPPTIHPIGARVAAAAAVFRLTFDVRDVVPENFSGTIDWGDGSEPTPFAGSTTQAAELKAFAVDHVYATRGTFTLTVNLSDDDGGVATQTASVRVGDVLASVYDDVNGNGTRDGGETGRPGVSVFLDVDRDGALDPGEPTGITDPLGDVLLETVQPGTYSARVIVPANWHISAPSAGFTDVTPGTASAAGTFGLTQVAAVSGTLFNDVNANGVRDAGEGPVTQTVRARRVDTGSAVSATPDAAGNYRFPGLLPGQYVIELANSSRLITAPYGFRGHVVNVTGEEAEVGRLDIGSVAATGATVSGTLYRDVNRNGTRDAGEPAAFNQTVYIDANNNGAFDANEPSGLSNSNGTWSIQRLPAGTFRVRQVLPPGSPAANEPSVSRDVSLTAGQTVASFNLARPFERTYYIRRSGGSVFVYNGTDAGQFIIASTPVSSSSLFTVSTGAADDWVIVDWTFGSPIPIGGLQIDGLGGDDTVTVVGTTLGDTAAFGAGDATVRGARFTHTGVERFTFDGKGGWDDVAVLGGPGVTFADGQRLHDLWVKAGASAVVATGGSQGLITRGLNVEGTLDLTDNHLVVDYGFGGGTSPVEAIRAGLLRGYSGGAWDGPGIMSSTAARTPGTAVGFGEATDLFGSFPSSFAGHGVDDTAVLLRYTLGADANLDRSVNGADEAILQANLGQSPRRFSQGDFNFDRVVDAADRAILDALYGRILNPGSVAGTVFDDENGNGVRDAGEAGLEGRTVYLDVNGNNAADAGEPVRTTDTIGRYDFEALAPGAYTLRQVVPAGWRQTAPGSGDGGERVVTLNGGQRLSGVDFGTGRIPAAIAARHVVYPTPATAGAGSAGGFTIAEGKSALLPGRAATYSNITADSRGITGVIIDVVGLPAGTALSPADFMVSIGGNGMWADATAPTVTLQRGAGAGGSDRIALTWPDNSIRNTWLRVTVSANARTGLSSPDVFYFGNLVGDTGPGGTPVVNAIDLARVRAAVGTASATLKRQYDLNRDGAVNAVDVLIVRANQGLSLPLFNAPVVTVTGLFSETRTVAAPAVPVRSAATPARRSAWDSLQQ
jgi:uncharacterized delta-60 repeat protein